MKKFFLSILLLTLPILASAYDCQVDGIYFNLKTGNEAEVTFQHNSYNNYSDYSGDVNIPEKFTYDGKEYTVTSIGDGAFYGCQSITSVTIPNSVTYIGNWAFDSCRGLNSVHITDLETWCIIDFKSNPLRYAHHLFLNGEEIRKLVIPNSVTRIGDDAFENCTGLTSVTIPSSVTSIGKWAFQNCSEMVNVSMANSVTTIGISAFAGCRRLTTVTIPNSVTSIEDFTFDQCTGLTSVTIPNSVTSIGEYAFQTCQNLRSLTIPNSVTTIGFGSFSACSGLTSVTLPNSIISIGNFAFSGCSSLTSLTIPNSVTSIGKETFGGCSGLTEVTIPNSVTSIGEGAFYDCRSLNSVTIPNSVTSIGEGAFYQCYGLKTLTLPEDLTIIEDYTFNSCKSLNEVVIPAKVEYINAEAFSDCIRLKSVTSLAMNPPYAYENTFSNYNITLYVHEEALKNYQETNPWSLFSELKTISGETVDNKCATPTISYANKKLAFSCTTEGAQCIYTITDSDIKTDLANEVSLSATYNISVYATKAGLENSEVATATLVWTEASFTETTPDTPTSAKAVTESIPVLISANNGNITVKSEADGQSVAVYSVGGHFLGNATISNGQAVVPTTLQNGNVAIVKVGSKSVKILIQ